MDWNHLQFHDFAVTVHLRPMVRMNVNWKPSSSLSLVYEPAAMIVLVLMPFWHDQMRLPE
jgi:hypothetical protein